MVLNHEKTEGVWFGKEDNQPQLNVKIKETIRTLGIKLSNKDSYSKNWEPKEKEIKMITEMKK